jgi:ATP-dependent Clp protease ATP-binding subunit ClpX
MLHNKRNGEILAELDNYVDGHIEAKKALISLVNRSKIRHHQKWIERIHKDYLIAPHKVLLIGQSGTGKTHLVESLQQLLDFPLIRLDATKLNPTGASGGVKEDDLRKQIWAKAKEWHEARRGYYHSIDGTVDQMVVFIDEIDKIGKSFDSSGNWNAHVQSNFLTMFDNKAEFAGVSFIFAGAFTDITKHKSKATSIGFNPDERTIKSREEIDEQVVKAGLIPELVGRLTNIVELDKFTEQDYYKILTERLIPAKLLELAFFNVFDSELDEDELKHMCKSAYNSGQGIRSLQRQLNKHYLDSEFDNEYKSHRARQLSLQPEDEGTNYEL